MNTDTIETLPMMTRHKNTFGGVNSRQKDMSYEDNLQQTIGYEPIQPLPEIIIYAIFGIYFSFVAFVAFVLLSCV